VIAPASRDYPVAFSSADGGKTFALTAVLGLQLNQNMYLMDDGHWDRRVYLPAYVRRYPFCMAHVTKNGDVQGERVVCVDDSAIDDDGDELFDEKGEALPTWSRIENFVTEYERDLMRSEEFFKLLAGLGLLEPISVTAELGEFTMQLAGFHLVDRDGTCESARNVTAHACVRRRHGCLVRTPLVTDKLPAHARPTQRIS